MWVEPKTVKSAPVHSIIGYGHAVDAVYWSRSGDLIMKIDVRLNGAPPEAVKIGQTIPDQDGGPYVVVEARVHGAGSLESVEVKAVREDVYLEAMCKLDGAQEAHAAESAD